MTNEIYLQFLEDTKDHVIRVQNNSGVHRSILFQEPGTMINYFELTTWGNHLAISGDISDGLIFTRLYDMFEFFRARKLGSIDFRYWAEKLTAGNRNALEYRPELAKEYINSEIESFIEYRNLERYEGVASGLRDAASEIDVDMGPDILYDNLYSFEYRPWNFDALPEVFTDIEPDQWYGYTYRFYLNCYAIQAGVHAYDRYMSGGDVWLHQESLLRDQGITPTKRG